MNIFLQNYVGNHPQVRNLMTGIEMVVLSGYLPPDFLNQNIPPQVFAIVQEMIGQVEIVQKLSAQVPAYRLNPTAMEQINSRINCARQQLAAMQVSNGANKLSYQLR